MRRWYGKTLAALAVFSASAFLADWVVLQVRAHGGSAYATVVVNISYVIHQKNGKLEYLYDPPLAVPCVRALFPHAQQAPCWWLARHTDQQKDITAN